MPTTKEITVYKWEELSQKAQEKARQWYLDGMDYEWWEGVYEMAIEDGRELGFYIDKIYFSGFSSQGDGACWIGQVDVRQWLEKHVADSIGVSAWCQLIQEDVVGKHLQVTQSGRYNHENTMQFGDVVDRTDDYEDDWKMELPSIFKGMDVQHLFDIIVTDPDCHIKSTEALTQAIEESAKDYARDIYQRLREEYDFLTTDEMMLDHFEANDYHFTNEGELA